MLFADCESNAEHSVNHRLLLLLALLALVETRSKEGLFLLGKFILRAYIVLAEYVVCKHAFY